MDNPKKLATLGTQDTEPKKKKQQQQIKPQRNTENWIGEQNDHSKNRE